MEKEISLKRTIFIIWQHGNIDELDEDIKEGYYDFMSKEHLCELIDIVREDAEKLQETE